MKMLTTSLAALGLAVTLGLAAAPQVSAKGHDQGSTDTPGSDVGSTTGSAQGLGTKGPSETPAGESPGNSANAGGRDDANGVDGPNGGAGGPNGGGGGPGEASGAGSPR